MITLAPQNEATNSCHTLAASLADMGDLDRAIDEIAAPQHGVLARRQATQAGATAIQIRRRFANGRWDDLGEEVIRMPGAHRTWRQSVSAARLAGPGGVASHRTAAAMYRVPGFAENRVEVLRLATAYSKSALATVHRTRWLPPWHVTVIDGIPVTTIARTLFDLAAVVSFPRLNRAVNNAMVMRLVTYEELDEMLQEMALRGRSGIGPMRRVLAKLAPGKPATASELEDEFGRYSRLLASPFLIDRSTLEATPGSAGSTTAIAAHPWSTRSTAGRITSSSWKQMPTRSATPS